MKKLIFLVIVTTTLFLVRILSFAAFEDEVKEVKGTIRKVESGLKRYRVVNNNYPEDGNRNLISSLCPDYIIFEPKETKDGLLIDPWGNPYVYQRYEPGDNLRWHTYVIYSVGPNGIDEDGYGDDIGNW